jgi:hypothetical protein
MLAGGLALPEHFLNCRCCMRFAPASQMAPRCEFGGDLAIRQTIGMQLLGQCDGVGSRLGVALAAFALAGRPLAIARPITLRDPPQTYAVESCGPRGLVPGRP